MDAWSYLAGTSGDAWDRMCGTSGDSWERLPGSDGDAWERLIQPCGSPGGGGMMSGQWFDNPGIGFGFGL